MPLSPFPPLPIDEALLIAETIVKQNSGRPMRRLTIFDDLNRSPSSSTSRSLVTASSGYGLTQGSYKSEMINLLDRGMKIVTKRDPKAKLDAVLGVRIFKQFYENYCNSIVPSNSAAKDFLISKGISEGNAQKCLEVLLRNGEYVGLIQEISGVKRIVSADYALEKLSKDLQTSLQTEQVEKARESLNPKSLSDGANITTVEQAKFQDNPYPSIHIDIQIHLSSDTTNEQIDQLFASMAKHLYPTRNSPDGQ